MHNRTNESITDRCLLIILSPSHGSPLCIAVENVTQQIQLRCTFLRYSVSNTDPICVW